MNDELIELDDALLLQQVGIYEYHHPLENAEMYRERLTALLDDIKDTVRAGNAIEASDPFAYNNSLAAGRKMTADFSKLMLRAYNAEADNCVRSLRAGALATATKRLETAAATIARLGKTMEMHVADGHRALRITELELTADSPAGKAGQGARPLRQHPGRRSHQRHRRRGRRAGVQAG